MRSALSWWRRLLRAGLLHGLLSAALLVVGGIAGEPRILAVSMAAAGVSLVLCLAAGAALVVNSRRGS